MLFYKNYSEYLIGCKIFLFFSKQETSQIGPIKGVTYNDYDAEIDFQIEPEIVYHRIREIDKTVNISWYFL